MPNTTVRDKTHMTAIWTTLMMKRLLSSGAAATKPLSVTTEEKLQQKNSSVLLSSPTSVWLSPVLFIFTFSESNFKVRQVNNRAKSPRNSHTSDDEEVLKFFWSSTSCFGIALLEVSCVMLPISERNEHTNPRLNSLTAAPACVGAREEELEAARAPPYDQSARACHHCPRAVRWTCGTLCSIFIMYVCCIYAASSVAPADASFIDFYNVAFLF